MRDQAVAQLEDEDAGLLRAVVVEIGLEHDEVSGRRKPFGGDVRQGREPPVDGPPVLGSEHSFAGLWPLHDGVVVEDLIHERHVSYPLSVLRYSYFFPWGSDAHTQRGLANRSLPSVGAGPPPRPLLASRDREHQMPPLLRDPARLSERFQGFGHAHTVGPDEKTEFLRDGDAGEGSPPRSDVGPEERP